MAERCPSLKERLGRLEAELDELIRLQESKKTRPLEDVNVTSAGHEGAMFSSHRNRQCCGHDPAASAPLSDISRFLQHINLNISKGTQAITKLATTRPTSHTDIQPCNNHANIIWRPPAEKKNNNSNEDELFKELREEKDKRTRAENQVKSLKGELKKTKDELEQRAESTIRMLQEELKVTSEKLKEAEHEMQRRFDEYRSAEYLWPMRYDTISKELQDEKRKRIESEDNARKLQITLQKVFLDTEEHLTLQKTASWIKNQNENLLCLAKNLRREIEDKDAEICGKNRCIEDNLRRIKQLSGLCGKLRDYLIVAKEKVTTTEDKLKLAMEHGQKLSVKMLQTQRQIEDLQSCREENKKENGRLSDLLRSSEMKNDSLHSRLDQISDMMKKQNELITRQSSTIDSKDEQLKLAYDNIRLQSQRLQDLEKELSAIQSGKNRNRNNFLQAELSRLQLDLETEKENAMIKDKIIESNLKTIADIKGDLLIKESDTNKLKRNLSETERKLSIEKTTNEELLLKIKQLQLRKEELKQRVEYLEEESLQATEHATKLEQIEKRIHLKQKEWEESKAKLLKEREMALEAERRSSQKLAEKSAEYKSELEGKQKIVDSLHLQIQEKDDQIAEVICENERLTKRLEEADENGKQMKIRFEEGLQQACEAWQKTMQQLSI